MNTYKIAVIAGDGIGPEVIAEGVKVLNQVAALDGSFSFDFTHFPWGCDYYKETGRTDIRLCDISLRVNVDAVYAGGGFN